MFKVMALIVGGIFLMAFGVYFLSVTEFPPFVFPFFSIQLPEVNWAIVGFVVIAGSLASFGTAFVASRMN